jgi:carboxyl-terminal processing protease
MLALQDLQQRGLQKLILDLRGNGGGIVDEAVAIADEFLDEDKLIVYTQGARSLRKEYRAQKPGLFEKGKLIVLVDEGTASASEILTGAIQDWDRGIIMGRRTFGKGLVQEPFQLSDGSELRLTVARYYTPLGRSIQKPYNKGRDLYNEEVMERFHDGEVIHGDSSIAHSGPEYRTPAGRIVYGGGGITPDIFVGFDTSSLSRGIAALYVNGTLSNFVYRYYMLHADALKRYKTVSGFDSGFREDPAIWNSLTGYAERDSVNIRNLSMKDRAIVSGRVKALLARLIWRTEGYFEVINRNDPVVLQALAQMQK